MSKYSTSGKYELKVNSMKFEVSRQIINTILIGYKIILAFYKMENND